ncbi:microfibril-associated glycoprotein 4-like [Branchiostoma floridae x Branchiostoma belcheri]
MRGLVVLAFIALLHQGGAVSDKKLVAKLPENGRWGSWNSNSGESDSNNNEAGTSTWGNLLQSMSGSRCEASCETLEEMQSYMTNNLQAQTDQTTQIGALQATVSSQDSTIQQQAAALAQLRVSLQRLTSSFNQLEGTVQQQAVSLQQQITTYGQQATSLQQQAAIIQEQASTIQQLQDILNAPRDCLDLYNTGHNTSGVYQIYPGGKDPFPVYCDMDTDGGGWTVFQRRHDGSVSFSLGWQDYKTGFGDIKSEFWLGNDNLARLTGQDVYELRVDLEDFEGNSAYAKYSTFRVEDELEQYKLTVDGYSGNAGDDMTWSSTAFFSTIDTSNYVHQGICDLGNKGGWWYGSCRDPNLNGQYLSGPQQSNGDGVNWDSWKGDRYSLKHTEMKIRPT